MGRHKKRRYDCSTREGAQLGYESGRSKNSLPFDDFVDLVKTGSTLEEIAAVAKVSRERIRQLYNVFIRPWSSEFKQLTGHMRRKKFAPDRALQRLKTKALESRKFKVLLSHLEGSGVELGVRANDKGKWQSTTSLILLNGIECNLHRVGKAGCMNNHPNATSYWRMWTTAARLKQTQFSIVVIDDPTDHSRVFVIPNQVLLDNYMDTGRAMIYIPQVRKGAYNNILPRVDFWLYEGAWDLLGGIKKKGVITPYEVQNARPRNRMGSIKETGRKA